MSRLSAEERERWQASFDQAKADYVRVGADRDASSVILSAKCGTGSRLLVHVSKLTEIGTIETGGAKLVSLMYPWQAVYPVNSGADGLFDSYLIEKFGGGNAYDRFGGDVGGVCEAIRDAVRVLDEYDVEPIAVAICHAGKKEVVTTELRPNGQIVFKAFETGVPFKTLDEAAVRIVERMSR